jgi:nucleoside-diphosphate-sugar epimerase
MVDGIVALMKSDLENGVNIGRREYVSVNELASLVAEIAGRRSTCAVDGPVGVARATLAPRISSIGWESKVSLEGLSRTYPWDPEPGPGRCRFR